ncbi:MAG: tyrosine-type recombinase/integrase [Spirochaetes bacterium]|nr:tyrosine-type recombinase/integrase [Spirochaetota bacterium]
MKHHIYSNRFKRIEKQLREKPLGPFVDDFISLLLAEGYSKKNFKSRLLVIKALNLWLISTKLDLTNLDSSKIIQFIKHRSMHQKMVHRGEVSTLNKFITMLRSRGIVPAEKLVKMKITPIEKELSAYKKYLIDEKGLSLSTISRYLKQNEKFLTYIFDTQPIDYLNISAHDILKFIQTYACEHSVCESSLMVCSIRSFLRFLVFRGKISYYLAECIPGIPNRRLSALPSYLSEKELSHLLKHNNGKTPEKIRNYAILLFLTRLGLRASEVAMLSLDDINWEEGEINIHGKGSKQAKFPLPIDVGNALVIYLKQIRPDSISRRIFFTIRAPFRPIKNGTTVSTIVKRALIGAGLNPKKKGAHLLRHTLATEYLRKGATLSEISEIMRHKNIDTTAIYIKVDFKQLQTLTMPWPKSLEKEVKNDLH